jgi:hypothetical protein
MNYLELCCPSSPVDPLRRFDQLSGNLTAFMSACFDGAATFIRIYEIGIRDLKLVVSTLG